MINIVNSSLLMAVTMRIFSIEIATKYCENKDDKTINVYSKCYKLI